MNNQSTVQFGCSQVVRKNGRTYFVWPLDNETKNKIRNLLNTQDLEFGFNNTLEESPPFFCPECGVKITFFDQVREALSKGPHTPEQLVEMLKKEELIGTGVVHNITCENGHDQIIPLGWATGFGWTYT